MLMSNKPIQKQVTKNVIDRDELAKRCLLARREQGLLQIEVIQEINKLDGAKLHKNFISLLEAGKIAFREPQQLQRLNTVADWLQFKIPYVHERPKAAPINARIESPESAGTPILKQPDFELTAVLKIGRVLEPIKSASGRRRVLEFCISRYADDFKKESE